MSFRSALAVFAHPDDESFGLGAVLAALAADGTSVRALCFTRGEASTLGKGDDLGRVRTEELLRAASTLGLAGAVALDHPDGGLVDVPLRTLAASVVGQAEMHGADLLVVFDESGVTGHSDHRRATAAALAAADGLNLPVLAWAIPAAVAAALNERFGTVFVGRPPEEVDLEITVDRTVQHQAIACHTSQSSDNPVLRARLGLMGDVELLRWLRAPTAATGTFGPVGQAPSRSS